jgi:hypothetical protein
MSTSGLHLPSRDLDLCRFHAGRNDEDQTAWRETTKTLVVGVAKWPELPVQPNVIGAQSRSCLQSCTQTRRPAQWKDARSTTVHQTSAQCWRKRKAHPVPRESSLTPCPSEQCAPRWRAPQWFDAIVNRPEHPMPASEALDMISPRLRSLNGTLQFSVG